MLSTDAYINVSTLRLIQNICMNLFDSVTMLNFNYSNTIFYFLLALVHEPIHGGKMSFQGMTQGSRFLLIFQVLCIQ